MAFPRGPGQCRLNRHSTLQLLHRGSGGRPGTAIDWIKIAAAYAVDTDRPLDGDALQRTSTHAITPERSQG